MISDLPLHCRGLFIVAALVAGFGLAGSTHPALARVATTPVVSPDTAAPSQGADGAIVVADNNNEDKDGNGHKNGKGKKSGDNGHNDDHNGHWNKNGNQNWNGNGQNWNGNNKNWKNGENWNGNNHNGNWNKNGGKNWSKNNHWNNHWNDDWNGRAYVRGWQPRPYYGDFFGGIVLGSLLAATGVGIVPYSPDPNLCWYWADPYMYRGYWDYCY
jgi:hypothetical protein